MVKLLLTIVFAFIGLSSNAQNLVQNPDFEDADFLHSDAKHWVFFYDYFNKHHPIEEMRNPNVNDSVKGTPFGDGFVGFSPFSHSIHGSLETNYLIGDLTDTLIVGHKYKLSFYYCSSGYRALDLKILDAYLGGGNWSGTFSNNPRDKGTYPTITFNLINNGVWNKAEGTFVAHKKTTQIVLGIFKHDNMTYTDLHTKYFKCQSMSPKRLLSFFTETQCLFYPKPYDANSTYRPFYMDSTGKAVLYDAFVKKNQSKSLGRDLFADQNVWPWYFIDNIELYDITNEANR